MVRAKLAATKAAVLRTHANTPYIRKVPANSIAIIILIAFVNVCVWIAVGIILNYNKALSATAVLAYTLGLRHALDADHISAIDLTTRRLVAAGQQPATVGTFFSLGHSTIVIITSIAVAATANAVSEHFDRYSQVGGIIGSSVSTAFLAILAVVNIWILWRLYRRLQQLIYRPVGSTDVGGGNTMGDVYETKSGGPLFTMLRRLFKLIDRPWKMYPLGVLFGLGFDTSSEVALLAISSIQAARGTSLWVILIYPLLFTSGMCLIDTLDGALMLAAYTSSSFMRDPLAATYYSLCLTLITCIVAVVIGVLQALTLAVNVKDPPEGSSRFWDGVRAAGDAYDIIGGAIVGAFIVFGGLSVVVYKPWRRWVDTRRQRRGLMQVESIEGREDASDTITPAATRGEVEDPAVKKRPDVSV